MKIHNIIKSLGVCMLVGVSTAAMAQNADKRVSGTVTDAATGKPLAGVSVQAYGNNRYAAMTDAKGHYEIALPDYVNSLVMVVDGYQLQQRALASDITKTDAKLYSSNFKSTYKSTTTAQMSLSADGAGNSSELIIDPVIGEQLGGDVRSISRGGNPGMGNVMLLDGLNSLNAGVQPLIVIDGVVMDMQYDRELLHDGYFNNLLAGINVNDIEKVTVLKNATALYGAKAANGVLLIETKRSKTMATRIDANINVRFEQMPKLPQMMGAEDYRVYASQLISNQTDNVASLNFLNPDPNIKNNFYYNKYHNNTDWTKEVYRDALVQNYGINVQGGDDIASYYISVGYAMANSTLKSNDFSRFDMRVNSDINITEKLKVRFDASYSDVDRDLRDDGAPVVDSEIPQLPTSTGFLGLVKSPFLNPYAYDLNGNLSHYLSEADDYTAPVFVDGSRPYDPNSLPNPNSILENGDGKNRNQLGTRLISFAITPRYVFNKHLSLSEHFSFQLFNVNENYYLPLIGTPSYRVQGLGVNTYVQNSAQSLASRETSIQSDTRLDWNNKYGGHSINVYGGVRILSQNYSSNSQVGYNTGNDKTPNMSEGLMYPSTSGADDKSRDITWYAVANYNWAEKYYVTGGISAQASSRFGEDAGSCFPLPMNYKWGFFPSINGAWVISNEPWMRKATAVNYLRVNVGFDVTGNDNLDYTASRTYYVANRMLGNNVDGLSIGNIGNTKLKWETTNRLTAGVEGNFFNNRLNARVNFFKSWTSDLLALNRLAWTSGLSNSWVNDGKLENIGINAALGVKVLALKNLQWEVGASVGHYNTKITSLPGNKSFETNIYGATVLTQVGSPVGVFYGYKALGVFATAQEAKEANLSVRDQSSNLHSFEAGDVKFADLNGDNLIDEKDRTVIGDPNPDIYGNIYTTLAWKNFTLSAIFNYSLGNDVFNYQRMLLEGGNRFYNQTTAMLNRWTTEGQVTDIPRASYGDPMGNSRFSDRWIEDGSYLRLSNVTLSYDVPVNFTHLHGLTVWASAANLFTITRYLGSNPDCALSGAALAQGIDRGLLSRGRSFSVGVKVNL